MLRLITTLCLMLMFLTAGSSQDSFPYGRYWELVIQGRVTDSTGAPIRGVQILASPDMPARLGKMTYYAVTDERGRYTLDHHLWGVQNMKYFVSTQSDGFVTVKKEIFPTEANKRMTVDFVLNPGRLASVPTNPPAG